MALEGANGAPDAAVSADAGASIDGAGATTFVVAAWALAAMCVGPGPTGDAVA
jgi:hypothetical protein